MTNHDAFLYTLRRQPRPAFASALHVRLDAVEPRPASRRPFARVGRALAAAGIAVAILWMVSPEVRAQIADVVSRITVIHFGDVELRAFSGTISGTSGSAVPIEQMTVSEARAVFPFRFPTWIPEGFVAESAVSVVHYSDKEIGIGQQWHGTGDTQISLTVFNNARPQPVVGASNAAREVTIGQHVGVLYKGSWQPDGQFGGDEHSLVWTDGERSYFLNGGVIPESDLLRMAESFE